MLKTNSKKYAENVRKYIIASIPDEWGNTDQDKLKNLKRDFDRVANNRYNLVRIPNEQARLADYLQGLPIDLEYANYEILQLDKRLREYTHDLTDQQQARLLDNYWLAMAYQIIKIW